MINPVIIPVRTGLDMTRRTIESTLAQDIAGGVTPIVIDNDSGAVAPYLRSIHAVAFSYRPEKGLHYVWNRALRLCFDNLRLPYALVINNDIEMRPDTYRLLVEDGGRFVTGIGVDSREATAHVDVSSRSPHPTFSCFLIRREVWQRIGEFDEGMHVYCGDCDYHVRMHRAGIVAYQLNLPFFHIGSGTLKQVDDATRDRICARADADRAYFRRLYDCVPGEPAYEALFDEATFGVEAKR